ncbi:MAG: Phenylacetic acid catabolic protein [Candidatus Binatia bacterium]
MKSATIQTFDDWKDLFDTWQKQIGYDKTLFSTVLQGYSLGEKFAAEDHSEIEFGQFAGAPKWEKISEIPRAEIKDLLLRLITVQGDTELASVEQQRRLLNSAPSERDFYSIVRINAEEMRHGWQMSHLLVQHFGDAGKEEARRLLERSADRKERILGAFNEPVESWVDFFTYTAFMDRDGMFQLRMLSHCGFKPLALSMEPMLSEESFHLITGLTGLQRILRGGKVPVELLQKVMNRWLPVCFDLFGHERSESIAKAYDWGLKGRFDEDQADAVGDPEMLNQAARQLYYNDVQRLIDVLNKEIAGDKPKLYVPHLKFNRGIGDYKGQRFSVHGGALEEQAYKAHLQVVLPTEPDRKKLQEITREPGWIAAAA